MVWAFRYTHAAGYPDDPNTLQPLCHFLQGSALPQHMLAKATVNQPIS
ncbi:hypothetical protein [Leptolyngbya sp. BC1307]|nr:hypothetical protein [Leptolyngbya sp. BC1307]